MKQDEQFNDILNECLDRLFKGETVEQCLKDYPAQAQELEPLLLTAKAARIASTLQPRPEFVAKSRYEFQSALNDMAAKKQRKFLFNWLPQWRWQSGWAIALIAFLVVVIGGGGTIAAASNSMPDSPLYSLKLATERVELAITPSDTGKAELNARFANRRVDEIGYMASKGDAQDVQIIAQRLNTNLTNITRITASNSAHNRSAQNTTATNGSDMSVAPGSENGIVTPSSPRPMLGAAPATAVPAPFAPPASGTPAADNGEKAVPPAFTAQAVPAPAVTIPPITIPTPAVNGTFSSQTSNSGNVAAGNQTQLSPEGEKLKKIIEDNYNERQAKLQETLANAPADVRPAVRQAIAESQAEYEQSLSNLYSGNGSN